MARLLILGAGIAGHTAALHANRLLGREHEVVVVSPNSLWNWIPSNIWVGVGEMKPEQVTFPLKPVYDKLGIEFHQARATTLHPEGDSERPRPFVVIESTDPASIGRIENISYDYLINATGPRLNFEATKGLGPARNSLSVCTANHAAEASAALDETVERMKKGEKQTFLIGTGHGSCTCQGAAFEYLFNVEFELRRRGVRDKARIVWISNEPELGDFGMGGMFIRRGGYITHSRIFTESLYAERGVEWITRAAVNEVDRDAVAFETLDGEQSSVQADFKMLLPSFTGVGLKSFDRSGADITASLFAPSGFMYVDGDYTSKPFEQWRPSDWPEMYQTPRYPNIYAIGIAFAPPHSITRPTFSPSGTPIYPTPPRTGMPTGVMAREVANAIVNQILGRDRPAKGASLARMGAACIASTGVSALKGTAVSMIVYPIVPDYETYPETGRDLNYTFGEIGLAGHWIKHLLHFGFLYKAKAKPFWTMIPE